MAFQVLNLEEGRKQVGCTPDGPVVHIITRLDGTFAIEEEGVTGPIYDDYRSALLSARKLCRDPDL